MGRSILGKSRYVKKEGDNNENIIFTSRYDRVRDTRCGGSNKIRMDYYRSENKRI